MIGDDDETTVTTIWSSHRLFSGTIGPHSHDWTEDQKKAEALAKELGDRAVSRVVNGRELDTRAEIEGLLYEIHGPGVWDRIERYEAIIARGIYVRAYGFAIPFREAVDRIVREDRPVLEIGAGSGLWSAVLAAEGVDVLATDAKTWKWEPTFYPVARRHGAPSIRANPERDVLLIWPTGGRWPRNALRAMAPGRTLYLISEGPEGCCASPPFFETLSRTFDELDRMEVARWPCIHDDFAVYRKR